MISDLPVLHHYTSGTGLLGIVESDSIWATLIHSLNDANEFGHAITEAKVYMFNLRRRSTDPIENAINATLAECLETIESLSVYVACFSGMEDSLGQWRGYCPPGFGYSIGLFLEELRRIARPQGFELHECIYDHKEQRRIIEYWVLDAVKNLRANLPLGTDPVAHVRKNCHNYFSSFVAFAPTLKNSAFKDEYEWRLVGLIPSTDPRIKLRPGQSMLIPYVPINLGLRSNDSLVWNIRIGPTPNESQALQAATHFFRRTRRIKNGISPSSVPFRPW